MNRNSKLWSFLLTHTWPLFNNNPEKFQTNDQVDDIYPFERKTAPIKLVRIHSPSTAALFTAALFTAVTGVIMNRSSNYSDNGRGCKLLGLKATYTPRLCVHHTMRYRDVPVGTCSKRCCIVLDICLLYSYKTVTSPKLLFIIDKCSVEYVTAYLCCAFWFYAWFALHYAINMYRLFTKYANVKMGMFSDKDKILERNIINMSLFVWWCC